MQICINRCVNCRSHLGEMFTNEVDGALAQLFYVVVFGDRVENDGSVDADVTEELETLVNERTYSKFVGAFQYRSDRFIAQYHFRRVDVSENSVHDVGGKLGEVNRDDFALNDMIRRGHVTRNSPSPKQ